MRLFANPRTVGALGPSGMRLGAAIAAEVDPAREGPVLELGPGTGVVTKALLARAVAPERLTCIEYDAVFAQALRLKFPRVRVIEGDAFRLQEIVGDARFAAIASSLPLLNFPMELREAFMADALSRLLPGAPLVQFSYGLKPSVPAPTGATVTLAARVWRNLPPAKVWVYRG